MDSLKVNNLERRPSFVCPKYAFKKNLVKKQIQKNGNNLKTPVKKIRLMNDGLTFSIKKKKVSKQRKKFKEEEEEKSNDWYVSNYL